MYKQREEIAQRNAAAAARSEAEVARIEAEHRLQDEAAAARIEAEHRLKEAEPVSSSAPVPTPGPADLLQLSAANEARIFADLAAKKAAREAAKKAAAEALPSSPADSESSASAELTPPPLAGTLSIRAPGSGSATLDQAADLQSATAKLQAIRAASAVSGAPKSPRNSQSPQYGTAFQSKGFTPAQAMAQAFQPGSTFRNLRGGRRKTARGRRRRRTYREPKGLFAF